MIESCWENGFTARRIIHFLEELAACLSSAFAFLRFLSCQAWSSLNGIKTRSSSLSSIGTNGNYCVWVALLPISTKFILRFLMRTKPPVLFDKLPFTSNREPLDCPLAVMIVLLQEKAKRLPVWDKPNKLKHRDIELLNLLWDGRRWWRQRQINSESSCSDVPRRTRQ